MLKFCSLHSKQPKVRKTAPKALKDPAAPKRPLSPNLVFAGEERKRVVAEMGNMAVGDVGKEKVGLAGSAVKGEVRGFLSEGQGQVRGGKILCVCSFFDNDFIVANWTYFRKEDMVRPVSM